MPISHHRRVVSLISPKSAVCKKASATKAQTLPCTCSQFVFATVFFLIAASFATLSSPARSANSGEGLLFKSCELKDPSSGQSAQATCSLLDVLENPDDPDSPTLQLHVARMEATGRRPEADPLLFITGGPGQAASESWAAIHRAFRKVGKKRDVYILDQRGTGLSNKLTCPAPEEEQDVYTFDAEATAELARDCLESFDADTRYYTTSIAVKDLEKLRDVLGIAQWNIYGVSYGTRVALHYLRRYPEHVRTMILDAAVPPGTALGPGIAVEAEKSLRQMFERCKTDEACNTAYPGLEDGTRRMLAELDENPVDIEFENFNVGTVESTRITANHITLTMRMLSYSSHGVAILPFMLHEAYANKNFAPFARQAAIQSNSLGESIATGMHNSIICTEDEPFSSKFGIDAAMLQDTYLGDTALKALEASCKHWPVGVIDDDFHVPLQSDAQVMILSGGADPVTPPSYGDRVADTLPNALHIVNPFQGHVQVALGCMPTVVSNFIVRGDTANVDFGCLERLRAEPFFVDANGPKP